MTEPVRLSKRVAQLKGCSRREAEQYIEGGWVTVDGVVVEEPMARVQDQTVRIDASASLLALLPVTILLHKPADAAPEVHPQLRASDDPSGVRAIKRHFAHLVVPSALPREASGLVVLSQDGRILRKLTEDAATTAQELIATVAGEVAPEQVQRLCHGLTLRGQPLPPIKVSINSTGEGQTRLRLALKGVLPEHVPGLCDAVGLRVNEVRFVAIQRFVQH